VDALRDAGQLALSLVAVEASGDADTVIGHVALSPVTLTPTPDGGPDWYGLGPLAVVPERQGQGVGSRLVRSALEHLSGLGAAGCVLLGDPAYYGRFGFRATPALVLAGVPAAYFQALAFGGAIPEASVAYAAAFSAGSDA
jgi:predicted N-acetyltransferase YhbS